MDPPCPPHWTFAARAAYFGERMCAFCDHRNPAGAKFCNDCASPLHLKPCNECNGVNDQAATNCYNCGAACPALSGTSEARPVLPSADLARARETPGEIAVTAVTQPLFATPASRAYSGLLRPGLLVVAALATIMIAGAYTAYYMNPMTPDAMEVVSEPVGAPDHNAPAAPPTVAMTVESKPVEFATTAALQAPIPATNLDAPKRESAGQRPVTVPAAKRASAHQRHAPERRPPIRATSKSTHSRGAVSVRVPVAAIREEPDRWQAMHASLARCSGDLITRIVCDQRVRRHYCEGHWDKAPECARAATERGQ